MESLVLWLILKAKAGFNRLFWCGESGSFSVEFKRPQKNDTINDIVNSKSGTTSGTTNGTINSKSPIEEIVVKLITEHEGLSARKISKLIDKSLRTTMRYLGDLKKSERIEFRGALKNGGYYLK
jgi:ATP-dependent DNA helicase RecG